MAKVAPFDDGDSDYGYELTEEEEALISAALETIPQSLPHAFARIPPSKGNRDDLTLNLLDPNDFDLLGSELDSAPVREHETLQAASLDESRLAPVAAGAPPDAHVQYPDCKHRDAPPPALDKL